MSNGLKKKEEYALQKVGFTKEESTYMKAILTIASCSFFLYKNKETGKNIIKKCTGGKK